MFCDKHLNAWTDRHVSRLGPSGNFELSAVPYASHGIMFWLFWHLVIPVAPLCGPGSLERGSAEKIVELLPVETGRRRGSILAAAPPPVNAPTAASFALPTSGRRLPPDMF